MNLFKFKICSYLCSPNDSNAGVAELVDVLDLGSSAARRGGSIPSARTSDPSTGSVEGFLNFKPQLNAD